MNRMISLVVLAFALIASATAQTLPSVGPYANIILGVNGEQTSTTLNHAFFLLVPLTDADNVFEGDNTFTTTLTLSNGVDIGGLGYVLRYNPTTERFEINTSLAAEGSTITAQVFVGSGAGLTDVASASAEKIIDGDLDTVVTTVANENTIDFAAGAIAAAKMTASLISLYLPITMTGATMTVSDNFWLGLGAAAGRIEFDDQAVDEVNVLAARMGIGTSTPGYSLDINGDFRVDGSLGDAIIGANGNVLEFTRAGENSLRATNAVAALGFFTGSGPTRAMFIDSAQKIGINTAGPDRRLDVLDASGPQLRLTYADGTVYTDVTTDSSGDLTINATGGNVILAAGDVLNQGTARGFNTLYDDAFTILDSAGDLGVDDFETLDDAKIGDDLTVGGELLGARLLLTAGRATGAVLSGGTSAYESQYLYCGNFLQGETYGFVMPRAGSVVGIGVSYSVSNADATGGAAGYASVSIDTNDPIAAPSFTAELNIATGGVDRTAYATQARGVDTFAAGARLLPGITHYNSGGDIQVDEVSMVVEVVFDN